MRLISRPSHEILLLPILCIPRNIVRLSSLPVNRIALSSPTRFLLVLFSQMSARVTRDPPIITIDEQIND